MATSPLPATHGQQLAKLLAGEPRLSLDAGIVPLLRTNGVLVQDPRRERPRYFDGRFLAARDLIRDQQYFLTREADLGRAAGSGVVHGLGVTQGGTEQALVIGAGQGVTPAGELVLLPETLTLDLADIPAAEQLSARFGLGRIASPPLRSRTGLFVLALRPVEFTANPIGAYPTSVTGPRTVEDGDVIEATALVLVPWQDDGAADALEARRGRAARTIFTAGQKLGVSDNVLPIAMIALQGNSLVWIDEALVRRELGADRGDLPGLGFSPRALRLAHLMQYQEHLADVVAQMHRRVFPAASVFPALPPAGPLPPDCIDTRDFTQRYFPSEVDVDFSIIPDDELASLVEESLALPPIDFLASEAALDLTAVLVLAPVPRADFRTVVRRLEPRGRVLALKPAAPNRLAQRKPLEILQRLRLPLPLAPTDPANPADAEWARLARLPNLWYVRRRNLAYRDDLAGTPRAIAGTNELAVERAVRGRVDALGLGDALDRVVAASSSKAAAGALQLLATPRIAASPALTAATIGALAAQAGRGVEPTIDQAKVLAVASEITTQGVGDGLARLEQASVDGVGKTALIKLASNDGWRKLDAMALAAPVKQVPALAARLAPVPAKPADAPAEPQPAPPPAAPAATKAAAKKTRPAKPAAGKTRPAARKAAAKKPAKS